MSNIRGGLRQSRCIFHSAGLYLAGIISVIMAKGQHTTAHNLTTISRMPTKFDT